MKSRSFVSNALITQFPNPQTSPKKSVLEPSTSIVMYSKIEEVLMQVLLSQKRWETKALSLRRRLFDC